MLHFTASIDNSQLQRDAEKSKELLRGVSKTAQNESNAIENAFKKISMAVVGAFSIQQAVSFVRTVVSVRGEIESLNSTITNLAGKQAGSKLFKDITDLAAKTPLGLKEWAKSAQTLMGFNIAAEDTVPIMKAIGDISMGNSERFQSLSLAFAQTASAGRLMGQDLMQMINAGFNPLAVISEQTGKSIAELKTEMAAGAISADQVKQAFIDATSEGGKFYGMLESQSQGINGAIASMKSAFEAMFNSIGESTQGAIVQSLNSVTTLVKNYDKLGRVIAEVAAAYGIYRAALMVLNVQKSISIARTKGWTKAELKQYYTTLLVSKAQDTLNKTLLKNPFVLVAAAATTLLFALYKLATQQTEAGRAQEKLNNTVKDFNKQVGSERVQIDHLFSRLKAAKQGTEEYQKAKAAIINQYGEYLEGMSEEVKNLTDIEGAYKAVSAAALQAAKERAMAKIGQEASDVYAEKSSNVKSNVYDLFKDKYKGAKGADGMSLSETYYWKIVPVLEGGELTDEVKKIIKEFDEKTLAITGTTLQGTPKWDYKITNILEDKINELKVSRKIFDETMQKAEREFGKAASASKETQTDLSKNSAVEIQNFEYWEKRLEEEEAKLKALSNLQLNSKEAEKIKQNIKEIEIIIEGYMAKAGKSDNTPKAIENRKKKLQEYAEAVAREAQLAEFEIEQAHINAMDEGLNRELRQNELTYKRMTAENIKRRKDMVEQLREAKQAEWELENQNAKQKGLTFDRNAITEKDLTSEQLKAIAEFERIAADIREKANKESLQKALQDVLTYEQKRTKIQEEYEQKRKNLYKTDSNNNIVTDLKSGKGILREGITEENIKILEQAYYSALYKLETDTKKTTSAIAKLFQNMGGKTTKELLQIAEQGRKVLELLTADTFDEEKGLDLGITREQYEYLHNTPTELDKIKEGIDNCTQAANNGASAFERLVIEITKLSEGGASIENLANGLSTIGGAVSEIINAVDFLKDSLKSLSKSFGSELLGQISGVLGDITDVAKEVMAGAKAGAAFGTYGAIAGAGIGLFTSGIGKIAKFNQNQTEKDVEKIRKKYNELEEAANLLGEAIDKAYSTDASHLIQQQDEIRRQQKELLKQEMERRKKSGKEDDKKRIEEIEKELKEIDKQLEQNREKAIDVIFGGSIQQAIESFTEAYINAWEKGAKGANIAKDQAKQMMRQMVAEMINAAIQSSQILEWLREQIINMMDAGASPEQIQAYAEWALQELENEIDNRFSWIGNLFDSEEARQGATKGIAQASQESIDELNGRMTAIQGHTYAISDNMKLLVANSVDLLNSVINIEMHTEQISKRIGTIETSTVQIKNAINDINNFGVTIK